MPARDIVQHILEGLTSLNPEAARQQQQRKNAADTLKQRLFSNSMEQQRMDLEKESAQRSQDHWDADQKYRADQEARQSKLDDANRQHNQLMEQMGLAQAGARPAAPDVTVPSLLPGTGNPPMTIPSMDAGRPTIQPSWSPTPMVLPTPEETGDTAGRVAAATAAAKGDEWSKEFEGRLSKLDPKWTTDPDNADKLNQLRATGGKFFPQDKATDPIKQLQQKWVDAGTPEERDAIGKQIVGLTNATAKGKILPGKAIDSTNEDPRNMYNSGYDEPTIRTLANQWAINGGDIGALGIGGAIQKQAVQMYGQKLHPGVDLAGNKLAYAAHKKALDEQFSQFNNILSYENTGKGNIQRMLDLAKDIPDALSPWLNKPYREFESTVLGDPKLSAFRTAAYTARNEYARITTGTPNMGGVVSEEARNDVKKALPDTATLGQLLSSGHVAVLDMEQRKQDKINQIEYLAKNAGKGIEGLKNVSDTPDAAKLDFDTTKPIKPATTTTPTVSNTPPPGIPPPPALPIGDGKTKLSAADKDKFLKAFNGDKDKARKAARDAKWVF